MKNLQKITLSLVSSLALLILVAFPVYALALEVGDELLDFTQNQVTLPAPDGGAGNFQIPDMWNPAATGALAATSGTQTITVTTQSTRPVQSRIITGTNTNVQMATGFQIHAGGATPITRTFNSGVAINTMVRAQLVSNTSPSIWQGFPITLTWRP